MIFATYFDPFTREFWGLWSDSSKPYVIKHGAADRFTGYASLSEAELAKKPEESIFQFNNHGWHKILEVAVRAKRCGRCQ